MAAEDMAVSTKPGSVRASLNVVESGSETKISTDPFDCSDSEWADRMKFLTQLLCLDKSAGTVPAFVWAALQLMPPEILKGNLDTYKWTFRYFLELQGQRLVKSWAAKSTSQYAQKSAGKSQDSDECVLTCARDAEMVHICPLAVHLSEEPDPAVINNFWALLSMIWGSEKVSQWKYAFSHQVSDNKFMRLTPTLARWFENAKFALKPVHSENPCEIRVQFFWLPDVFHGPGEDKVPISAPDFRMMEQFAEQPRSTEGLFQILESGTAFAIHGSPDELPSIEMLEMQWNIQRLLALSGAANTSGFGTYASEWNLQKNPWTVVYDNW